MWLWCSYSERLHYHGSYCTDHTNTFHQNIVDFCELLLAGFQCDSVGYWELTSCRDWIQHHSKIQYYESRSAM